MDKDQAINLIKERRKNDSKLDLEKVPELKRGDIQIILEFCKSKGLEVVSSIVEDSGTVFVEVYRSKANPEDNYLIRFDASGNIESLGSAKLLDKVVRLMSDEKKGVK